MFVFEACSNRTYIILISCAIMNIPIYVTCDIIVKVLLIDKITTTG